MPTYDYKCLNCGEMYEFFHKMNENPAYACPSCGNELKKMIGTGGIPIFKGSGFYQTDYKNKTPNNKSKETKSPKSSDSKKD